MVVPCKNLTLLTCCAKVSHQTLLIEQKEQYVHIFIAVKAGERS